MSGRPVPQGHSHFLAQGRKRRVQHVQAGGMAKVIKEHPKAHAAWLAKQNGKEGK